MKFKLLLIAGPLFLAGCASSDVYTEKERSNGFHLSEPLMLVAAQQTQVYYSAMRFNPRSRMCWMDLRSVAKLTGSTADCATTIVFLDSVEFAPNPKEEYTLDRKLRRQVIAQVQVNNALHQFEFKADPFGYGRYREPR